jgi:hypothetical protein
MAYSNLYVARLGATYNLALLELTIAPASYNIVRNFQRDGVWNAMWESLHMDLRVDLAR